MQPIYRDILSRRKVKCICGSVTEFSSSAVSRFRTALNELGSTTLNRGALRSSHSGLVFRRQTGCFTHFGLKFEFAGRSAPHILGDHG